MDMILNTNSEQYKKARNFWTGSKIKNKNALMFNSTYEDDIVRPFITWLNEQGCTISIENREDGRVYGVDSYCVAVGTDVLAFDCEEKYTVFLLRWS